MTLLLLFAARGRRAAFAPAAARAGRRAVRRGAGAGRNGAAADEEAYDAAKAGTASVATSSRAPPISTTSSTPRCRSACATRTSCSTSSSRSPSSGTASATESRSASSARRRTRSSLGLRDTDRTLADKGIAAPLLAFLFSFGILFREGLEAVLVIAILLGSLASGRATGYRRPLGLGILAASARPC